jgi:hypothetical protein
LVLLAVIAALGAFRWLQNRNAPLPAAVNLTIINGEALVKRADAGSGPPLKAGDKVALQRGDEVRTRADAKAKLTFSGGETTELSSDTYLTILELYQAPVSRALVVSLALHEGKTLTRIRHVLLHGMKFEIETPAVTLLARGTVFQCDVLSKSQVYVAVYDGVVTVSMGEQSVELQAGQGLTARLGQSLAPVPVSQAPPPDTEPTGEDTLLAPPTLTEREKTLFPPVLTPTRPGDNMELYTVQPGDTLFGIARRFGVSWEAILAANKDTLKKPELLRVGQQLRIPKP